MTKMKECQSRREFLGGVALAGLASVAGCKALGGASADGGGTPSLPRDSAGGARGASALPTGPAALAPRAPYHETARDGTEAVPPETIQKMIDEVSPQAYGACRNGGEPNLPALRLYDKALDRAVKAVLEADVSQKPAVGFVYNMGVVIRTKQRLFTVDLCHRRACELCERLDFALITHNHGDHYTDVFLQDMDRRGKTVVTNFDDNYGAHFAKKNPGGFTRGGKVFTFGDATVRTSVSDHNKYLIDYTMPFEITVGGYTIYHTGDSQNIEKLNPTRTPDLWLVHPYCGLDVVKAAQKFHPKRTAVLHLNEMGHAKNRWRFSFAEGETRRKKLQDAGFEAVVPLWGERLA